MAQDAERQDLADGPVGILVHGGNHFIVRGPLPNCAVARALARHWSVIRIGADAPPELRQWTISTREFRENLQWAVLVPNGDELSEAVAELLSELAARGVVLLNAGSADW